MAKYCKLGVRMATRPSVSGLSCSADINKNLQKAWQISPQQQQTQRFLNLSAPLSHPLVIDDDNDRDVRATLLDGSPREVASNEHPKKKGKIRPEHSWEDSIRYMESQIFQDTYKDVAVWRWYRRNIRGQEIYQHLPTFSCVDRHGIYRGNNPCPICRDVYLVIDYRNIPLLKMFLNEESGEAIPLLRSGLCQDAYLRLEVAIMKARDYGLLTFDVPFRTYDYKTYYPEWTGPNFSSIPETPQPMPRTVQQTYTRYPEFIPDKKTKLDRWWERWDKYAKKY